jgi:hypothetical protein
MKKIKFILKCFMWMLIILTALVVGVYFFLGTIVEKAIINILPSITQTAANVDKVDLSLLSGRVEILGLKIGNPKGYSDNNIFELGKILVTFEPKSILTDKIVINSVEIVGTGVSAELKNLKSLDTNVSQLQKNIESYLGSSEQKNILGKTTLETDEKTSGGSGKKVIIKDLKINDTKASFGISGKTVTIPLPDIHKTGIGEGKENKSFAEIIADILNMISWESVKATGTAVKDLTKQGISEVKNMIQEGKESLEEKTKSTIQGLKGIFQ